MFLTSSSQQPWKIKKVIIKSNPTIMQIEQEIELNTSQQTDILKQIKEANRECREHPEDKIFLFKLSMLTKQYDLYNETINELKQELNA